MTAAARTINFILNGRPVTADVKPHHNLVEVLQAQFALFGARESCGQGLCGCCTVLVDGRPVSGCLYLAVFADGAEVATIEHLGSTERSRSRTGGVHRARRLPVRLLHARLRADGEGPAGPTSRAQDEQIKDYLSGKLCRCAAYPEIINAVELAARKNKAGEPAEPKRDREGGRTCQPLQRLEDSRGISVSTRTNGRR